MADDTYAVVDMSKKVKNRERDTTATTPLYSSVDKSKKKTRKNSASEGEDAATATLGATGAVPVYAAVDKSKKRKKSEFVGAEETAFSDVACPTYDSVEAAAEPVITTADAYNEGAESDYSMIMVKNLTNSDSCRVSREKSPAASGKKVADRKENDVGKNPNHCKTFACIFVAMGIVFVIMLTCIAVLFYQIAALKASEQPEQQASSGQPMTASNSSTVLRLLQELNQSIGGIEERLLLQNKELELNITEQGRRNRELELNITEQGRRNRELELNITEQGRMALLMNQQIAGINRQLNENITMLVNQIMMQEDSFSDTGSDIQQQLNKSFDQISALENMTKLLRNNVTMEANTNNALFMELRDSIENNLQQVRSMLNSTITTNKAGIMANQETIAEQQMSIDMINTQLMNVTLITMLLARGILSSSCAALPSSSPPGYYWVTASDGSAVRVYCTRSCGGVTGNWTRVAYLNMTNSSQKCSSHGLIPQTSMSGEQICVISNDDAGCSSVNYSTHFSYSKVCGKILARAVGNPDGFGTHLRGDEPLKRNYVDGVSLTHEERRQHIWSFAAYCYRCQQIHPSFINDEHFFCANRSSISLWDDINACRPNNPPWFHRELSELTTDDIEMRVCRDEGRGNEDIGITHIELYVQ